MKTETIHLEFHYTECNKDSITFYGTRANSREEIGNRNIIKIVIPLTEYDPQIIASDLNKMMKLRVKAVQNRIKNFVDNMYNGLDDIYNMAD